MLLLLAIGLKGGIELARQPFGDLALQALAVMAMRVLLPLVAFPVLRFMGRFPRADAASVAAHSGSMSVGTSSVPTTSFPTRQLHFESHMPFLLPVLDIPPLPVALLPHTGFSLALQFA